MLSEKLPDRSLRMNNSRPAHFICSPDSFDIVIKRRIRRARGARIFHAMQAFPWLRLCSHPSLMLMPRPLRDFCAFLCVFPSSSAVGVTRSADLPWLCAFASAPTSLFEHGAARTFLPQHPPSLPLCGERLDSNFRSKLRHFC